MGTLAPKRPTLARSAYRKRRCRIRATPSELTNSCRTGYPGLRFVRSSLRSTLGHDNATPWGFLMQAQASTPTLLGGINDVALRAGRLETRPCQAFDVLPSAEAARAHLLDCDAVWQFPPAPDVQTSDPPRGRVMVAGGCDCINTHPKVGRDGRGAIVRVDGRGGHPTTVAWPPWPSRIAETR